MKTLIIFVVTCALMVTINAGETYYEYICPHEITIYLDYSATMCDIPGSTLGSRWNEEPCEDNFLCKCDEEECHTLGQQKIATDELIDSYYELLKIRQTHTFYPEDAVVEVKKYSDEVVYPPAFDGPIHDFTSDSIVIDSSECLGYTQIQNVYHDYLNTCYEDSYKAHPGILISDFIWYYDPDKADVPAAIGYKREIPRTRCPVICFQIGENEQALTPEELSFDSDNSLCDYFFNASDYFDFEDGASGYVNDIVDILLKTCDTLNYTLPEKIHFAPTPTPYVENIEPYQAPYEDPPVVVSSDSKDGFWWWWILLAAIGALLCCLGGALAYKCNKRKPELDIQHENMDLPCEDEVVVDDAQIHIRN